MEAHLVRQEWSTRQYEDGRGFGWLGDPHCGYHRDYHVGGQSQQALLDDDQASLTFPSLSTSFSVYIYTT